MLTWVVICHEKIFRAEWIPFEPDNRILLIRFIFFFTGAQHVSLRTRTWKQWNVLQGCRGSIHTWHCCMNFWREITVHAWNCQDQPWAHRLGALWLFQLCTAIGEQNSTGCANHPNVITSFLWTHKPMMSSLSLLSARLLDFKKSTWKIP